MSAAVVKSVFAVEGYRNREQVDVPDVMQETEIIGQVDVGATVHQLWGGGGDCSIVMADATYLGHTTHYGS